jgi:phosphoribosylglycinamide formyltransferase-1
VNASASASTGAARGFRLAVLASGRGSNLGALIRAASEGRLGASVVGVFSDRPGCGALEIAARHAIPTRAARTREFASREAFDEWLFDAVAAVQPDLIVCAGYMRIISDASVRRAEGRMINIHPSLLPRHPGLDTHARALQAGDAEHGASVHYVIPALDAGPVIAQVRLAVQRDDSAETLAARVIAREHALLCACVAWIAAGRIRMQDGGVICDGQRLARPLLLGPDDGLVAGACA